MLHKCYRLIYVLLSASEPIAEALMPVHNQLLTVRRCLLEVKKWGGEFTGNAPCCEAFEFHDSLLFRFSGLLPCRYGD